MGLVTVSATSDAYLGYDTVKLFIPRERIPFDELIISKDVWQSFEDGTLKATGYAVGNIRIAIGKLGMTIKGSLGKLVDKNKSFVGPEVIAQALNIVSEFVGFDVSSAHVTRLDFYCDCKMNHSPSVYLRNLGDCSRRKKFSTLDSIKYHSKHENIACYNKTMEQKSKRDIEVDKNLLRIEMQLIKKVNRRFNMETLLAKDLTSIDMFLKAKQLLLKRFVQIQKHSTITPHADHVKNIKDFENYLFMCGMEFLGGADKTMGLIDASDRLGHFDNRSQKSRIKTKLKQLEKRKGELQEDGNLQELIEKFTKALTYEPSVLPTISTATEKTPES